MIHFGKASRTGDPVSMVWHGTRTESDGKIQYDGYRTVLDGTTEFEMIGKNGQSCTVKYCADTPRNPRILTDSTDWFFTFPGNDPEPTLVNGLRGYIIDRKTCETIAKITFIEVYMSEFSACSYCLTSPDGEIFIKSYSDYTYSFFREDELIADFSIKYDPESRRKKSGLEFPMFYSAYCSDHISEITRTLVLSIPFLRYIGIGTDGRGEKKALKNYGSKEKLQYLEYYRSYPVSECSISFQLEKLASAEREAFVNDIGIVFPLQSYRWRSHDQLDIEEIGIENIEEMEKNLLKLIEWYPHTEICIQTQYGPSPDSWRFGLPDHGGYLTVY